MKPIVHALLAVAPVLTASAVLAQQTDFSIEGPPPAFLPNDVLNPSGTSVKITVTVPAGVVVRAFSYGLDRVEPLGPTFWSAIQYSVERGTQGLQNDGRPGAGAVWRQSNGNGAAGDKFVLKATRVPGIGMWPISRGLTSDAPMHNLIPNQPGPETELDGLAFEPNQFPKRFYFSVASVYPGQPWGPSDILVMDINLVGGVATTVGPPRLWASGAQLGLVNGDNIDALAILTSGTPAIGASDVVWVSLTSGSPTRQATSLGSEAVLIVFPGPIRVVFDAPILNLKNGPGEELDGLTAFDPGPLDRKQLPPPRQKPQEKK